MTPPPRPRRDDVRAPIVVAADSAPTAARIEALLHASPAARVIVARAGDLTLSTDDEAGVVILAMAPAAVARALEAMRRGRHAPPVIVLTSPPHEAWTARARRRGVRAVLRPDATEDELAAAIAAVRAGLLAVHHDAVSAAPALAPTSSPSEPPMLTPREIEVLEMMAEGMSNRAIAARLKISRHTVKFHVASLLTKLAVRSRTEAVTAGVRRGLIAL